MEKLSEKIWCDGKLIGWEDANVHIMTYTLHYGLGVFEGIRCYRTSDGRSAIFRNEDHIRRFFGSAKIVQMEIPFTQDEIRNAIKETIKANGFSECYIRPIAIVGEGPLGLYAETYPVKVFIITWEWGEYLGEGATKRGIRAKISSFTRHYVNAGMTKGKIAGNYVNSILAKKEAIMSGFDEAIMLDTEGYISEGSGENVFIVKDGVIKTTPLTSILSGITRDSVIRIARDLGIEVAEERFTRDELYLADEAFLCGTAAEITPIREVDGRTIGEGSIGPITKKLQDVFFKVVRGEESAYREWLDYLD